MTQRAEIERLVALLRRGLPNDPRLDGMTTMTHGCEHLRAAADALSGLIKREEAAQTRALNMTLTLETAIKHKLETQTHGGLTEFGEGGLAALRSLEREFERLKGTSDE